MKIRKKKLKKKKEKYITEMLQDKIKVFLIEREKKNLLAILFDKLSSSLSHRFTRLHTNTYTHTHLYRKLYTMIKFWGKIENLRSNWSSWTKIFLWQTTFSLFKKKCVFLRCSFQFFFPTLCVAYCLSVLMVYANWMGKMLQWEAPTGKYAWKKVTRE